MADILRVGRGGVVFDKQTTDKVLRVGKDGIVLNREAAAAGGRVMSSLAGAGGLAGHGGIAGAGGGLAG